jgi:hypothetical protein
MVAGIAGYAVRAFVLARGAPRQRFDRALIALGGAGLAWVLFAPDQYLNTMLCDYRFFGCSAMFLLLGLPSPGGRALPALAGLLAVAFALVTTAAWVTFDAAELSGLRPSLAALDRPRRVLGLDYRKHSEVFRDRPFMQLFAYAQAAHGGELSFSFAEHQSSLVSYREPPHRPWTAGLEWSPELATARDVAAFECVLVNGSDEQHGAFAARFGLRPLVHEGWFRLYCQGAK